MAKNISWFNTIFFFLLCGSCGLLITFLLLLFFSWAIVKFNVPLWCAVPVATCAVCIGCMVSSFVFSCKFRKNRMLNGIILGFFFFLVYLIASIISGDYSLSPIAYLKLASCIFAGALGSYISIGKFQPRYSHK